MKNSLTEGRQAVNVSNGVVSCGSSLHGRAGHGGPQALLQTHNAKRRPALQGRLCEGHPCVSQRHHPHVGG